MKLKKKFPVYFKVQPAVSSWDRLGMSLRWFFLKENLGQGCSCSLFFREVSPRNWNEALGKVRRNVKPRKLYWIDSQKQWKPLRGMTDGARYFFNAQHYALLIIWLKRTSLLESLHIFSLETIKTAQSLSRGHVAAHRGAAGGAERTSQVTISNWVTLGRSFLTWSISFLFKLKGLGITLRLLLLI